MKNKSFRMRTDQSDLLRKNLENFENETLKKIASNLVGGYKEQDAWLKAHGDVSWNKAAQ